MKKLISILLVLTVLVNVIGFGFLNVKASAVAPLVAAIIEVVKGAIVGAGAGVAASAGTQATVGAHNILSDSNTRYFYEKSIEDVTSDNLIIANIDSNNYVTFEVSPNVSAESAEFAEILANKLNNLDSIYRYVDPDGFGNRINAQTYARVKNDVTNEYLDYIYNKSILEGYSNLGESAYVDLPDYDFDWTGPMLTQSIAIPTSQGFKSNTIGGFSLSRAFINVRSDGYFTSEDAARAAGCDSTAFKNADGSCVGFITLSNMYGCGKYIVYNGKIYYNNQLGHRTTLSTSRIGLQFNDSELSYYNSADGENLAQAGCTTTVGLSCGYYTCVDPNATTNYPVNFTQDDLIEETGGGELTVPVRDDENIIAQYIQSIGDPESMLEIAPDGSITGADGITIEQIQALLEDLANQLNTDIDLSSLEAYLQAIEKACRNTLTGEQLNQALKGIKSKIKDYSGDLSKILSAINGVKALDQTQADKLTSIEEQTKAIAEALTAEQTITAEKTFDIDTPSVITDKFPFSLPFDVYNIYNLLSAEPEAPKFTIPIKMDGVFDYTFEVDLSEYEWIAVIVRWLLFIIFIVGLIIVTNKLIGRG